MEATFGVYVSEMIMYEELVQRWLYMLLRSSEGSAKNQKFGLSVWELPRRALL